MGDDKEELPLQFSRGRHGGSGDGTCFYRGAEESPEIRGVMDLQLLETAVREVSYWAVLVTGCLCLIGGTAAIGHWSLRKLLSTLGLYREFLAFVKTRKR